MSVTSSPRIERAKQRLGDSIVATGAVGLGTLAITFGIGQGIQHSTNEPELRQAGATVAAYGHDVAAIEFGIGAMVALGLGVEALRASMAYDRYQAPGPAAIPARVQYELSGPGLAPDTAALTYGFENSNQADTN